MAHLVRNNFYLLSKSNIKSAELDPTKPVFGVDPLLFYGGLTVACGGAFMHRDKGLGDLHMLTDRYGISCGPNGRLSRLETNPPTCNQSYRSARPAIPFPHRCKTSRSGNAKCDKPCPRLLWYEYIPPPQAILDIDTLFQERK